MHTKKKGKTLFKISISFLFSSDTIKNIKMLLSIRQKTVCILSPFGYYVTAGCIWVRRKTKNTISWSIEGQWSLILKRTEHENPDFVEKRIFTSGYSGQYAGCSWGTYGQHLWRCQYRTESNSNPWKSQRNKGSDIESSLRCLSRSEWTS